MINIVICNILKSLKFKIERNNIVWGKNWEIKGLLSDFYVNTYFDNGTPTELHLTYNVLN